MKRDKPPIIKIYEALGCLADDRVEIEESTSTLFGDVDNIIKAKVYSSSKQKFYEVSYDQLQNAIMANDNGSYRKGYLGYPSIALLLKTGKLEYKEVYALLLKDIKRKDINTKNNNDFDLTIKEIDQSILDKGGDIAGFHSYVEELEDNIIGMDLNMLGNKKLPPKGY